MLGPRIPPALAARLMLYREDENAAAELAMRVQEYQRARRESKRWKLSPRDEATGSASPRLARASVTTGSVSADGGGEDGAPPPGRGSSRGANATPPREGTPRTGALSGRRHALTLTVDPSIEPLPVPGPLPPVPDSPSAPLIERARGWSPRALDPLQKGDDPSTATVRGRERRSELSTGYFRTGMGTTEVERISSATASLPIEVKELVHHPRGRFVPLTERQRREQKLAAVESRMRWCGSEFVAGSRPTTPAAEVLARDASLRADCQTPFVDAVQREQETGRHRNKVHELSPRTPRLPPQSIQPLPVVDPEPHPDEHPLLMHGGRLRHEVDAVEIRAARAILSKHLTIYRRFG